MNRRESLKLLAGAGAAAAGAATAGSMPAAAQQQRPGEQRDMAQGAGFYSFRINPWWRAAVVSDGTFPFATPAPTLGANAPEAQVKQALADAYVPYDNVLGHVNVLVLRGSVDTILIDAGCGPTYSPTTGRLMQHLGNLGVEPRDVSLVIITHAHRDHIGGILDAGGAPVFPNARYVAHRDELKFWADGNPDLSRSTAPPEVKRAMAAGAARTFKAIDDVTEPVTDGSRLPAGMTVVAAPGHTPGHFALFIDSGGRQLLYITDAAHHPAVNLPHPDWHVAFDADPAMAAKSRRALLDRAAADKVLVCGSHLPFPGVGHVRAVGKGFEWVPAVWEW